MALGQILREAREAQEQTASEVAAATRMKVQVVEAIEAENFRRFAAPIYGKGFIKLYAEHVGLDPQPLIDEYLAQSMPSAGVSLKKEPRSRPRWPFAKPRPEPEEEREARPDPAAQRGKPPPRISAFDAEPPPAPAEPPPRLELDLFAAAEEGDEEETQVAFDAPPADAASARPERAPPAEPEQVQDQAIPTFFQAVSQVGGEMIEKHRRQRAEKRRKAGRAAATAEETPAPAAGAAPDAQPRREPFLVPKPERAGSNALGRAIGLAVGAIVLLVLLVSSLSRCTGERGDTRPGPAGDALAQDWSLAVPPPEPYFE